MLPCAPRTNPVAILDFVETLTRPLPGGEEKMAPGTDMSRSATAAIGNWQCPRLLAGVNELDAVSLSLEAEREVESLPTVVLTLILIRRQRCEGDVACATKASQS